jgi:hypothetical protein
MQIDCIRYSGASYREKLGWLRQVQLCVSDLLFSVKEFDLVGITHEESIQSFLRQFDLYGLWISCKVINLYSLCP